MPSKTKKTPPEEEPRQLLSLRAFAAHRDVSPAAVRKAMATGRLTEASCSRTGRGHWKIDVEKADAEWEANTDPLQQREKHRQAADDDSPTLFPDAGKLPPGQLDAPKQPKAPAATAKNGSTLADLQAEKLRWQTENARLEFQRTAGELVERRDVEREADRCARLVRDALLRVPDRVAALCASSGDVAEISERIESEIRDALEAVAEQLEKDDEDEAAA